MADDREILRELWDGKVPVCFNLADEEVYGVEQPEAFYLLVPRQSYFSLVTDKVQRHFLRHVDQQKVSEMWLESEGQPLKWHYPIGVLFDIYGAESTLPWNLTVHFQNFPEDELLHCTSREVVEAQYMAMVKEADTLKHKAQIINSMQRKDHKQLWMGLQNDKFDQFWSINRKLMEHTGDEPFKYIPFRIYQPEKSFIQKLFKPQNEDGEYHTLEDLLREFLPDVLLSQGGKYKVVLQGIEVPLETSLQWLSEHFSHPDNFLHICALPV